MEEGDFRRLSEIPGRGIVIINFRSEVHLKTFLWDRVQKRWWGPFTRQGMSTRKGGVDPERVVFFVRNPNHKGYRESSTPVVDSLGASRLRTIVVLG